MVPPAGLFERMIYGTRVTSMHTGVILILFKKAKSLFIAPEARSGSHGTVLRALRGISVRSTRILKLIISI